jgi:hypothetical protein
MNSKKDLTERDICTKLITPAHAVFNDEIG